MLGTSGFYGRYLSVVTEIQGLKELYPCHRRVGWAGLRKIPYSLVEARRKNVLAHAARFCRASARIVYASSFLRFRISLGLNSEPSKPHKQGVSADIIQNSAVGNFSPKTEGTKTKAAS